MIAKHLILFYVLCVYPNIEALHPNNTYDPKQKTKEERDKENKDRRRRESMLNGFAWHLVSFGKCSKSKAINENYLSFANSILLNRKEFRFFFSLWQKYFAICVIYHFT